ncbi:MAG: AAA family ATPase [Caldisericia bacterium]|nr:AAA family ATPase [Caldisericia bacterium]MDD4614619.1 AAA family ATPase [Caldisericia bacterium]
MAGFGFENQLTVVFALENASELDTFQPYFDKNPMLKIEDLVLDGFILDEKIRMLTPDILILDYHLKNIHMINFLEEAIIKYPSTSIVLIVREDDLIDIRKIVKTATRNVITRPFDPDTLPQIAMNAFVSSFKDKKYQNAGMQSKELGKLLSFTSAKGGVGKSLLSVNLALVLANLTESFKILLMDLGLPYGDQRAITNISPDKTQSTIDLFTIADELSPERLSNIVQRSEIYPNFDIVMSPGSFDRVKEIENGKISKAIRTLKLIYDYIIVDLDPGVNKISKIFFEQSDKIFIVFTPEIPSLFRLVNYLKEFQWLKISTPPEIIYNKRSKKADQKIQSILQKILPYQLFGSVREDNNVAFNSMNNMFPAVTKKGVIRKDIMDIAEKILEWEGN